MTICRYFLQGNCRFGDRCRFEHTQHQERNYGYSGQQNYGYDRSRNTERSYSPGYDQSYDAHYGNQRYNSPNRNQSERYNNERNSYAQYENEQYKGYSNRNVSQRSTSNQRYPSEESYSQNAYGQNRYRWLADDYKQQTHSPHSSQSSVYKTSTPKPASSFSFKLPESEIKRDQQSSGFSVDEKNGIYVEVVKEDATAWELGEHWPFSCYFPFPDKCAFPGFSDVSPEEMRYEAYKAKENNTFNTYVETVHNALLDIKKKRDHLKQPTTELISIIAKIRRGEDLSSLSTFADRSSIFQTAASESMISENISSVPQVDASTFSFKLSSKIDASSVKSTAASFSFKATSDPSSVKSAAASFSFKATSDQSSALTRSTATVGNGVSEIYTPMEGLTDDEKEQFNASTFTLGRIPTNPPPRELCL